MDKIPVSQADYDAQSLKVQQLERELLETQDRLASARSEGDLRENAQYESAVRDKERITNDILLAKELLGRMYVETTIVAGKIRILSRFKVLNENTQETMDLQLVATDGTPPDKVSVASKFGKLVLGKRVGDKVSYVDNAFRQQEFSILSIS